MEVSLFVKKELFDEGADDAPEPTLSHFEVSLIDLLEDAQLPDHLALPEHFLPLRYVCLVEGLQVQSLV